MTAIVARHGAKDNGRGETPMHLSNLFCSTAMGLLFGMAAGDPAGTDLQTLQGTWIVLAGNEGGKTLPPPRVKGSKMLVKNNTMKVYEQEKELEMSFRLDAAKEPKAIDLTITGGKRKGEVSRGVYAIDGDMLKICFAPQGSPRPSNFLPRQGSTEMLFVLRRAHP
jgi:uncharacterized protein (TIGR03067 family)